MKKVCRRSPFTLLEVALALSLASIALFFLFSTLKTSTFFTNTLVKERSLSSKRDLFYQRLLHLFSKTDQSHLSLKTVDGIEVLYFTFDNGPDPNPSFGGVVEGKLSLRPYGSLMLDINPLKNGTISRTELLFEEVKSIEWTLLENSLLATVHDKSGRVDYYPIFFPSQNEKGHIFKGASL